MVGLEAQTAWSEVSEKTDSKLDEIAELKEKERQAELEKKMKKMRERDPFIYD